METTGQTGKPYALPEDVAIALAALIEGSASTLHEPLAGNERLINDIYTGRDPLGGAASMAIGEQGIPAHTLADALSTVSWRPPETTANLFLSRLRQIVANLTPGVPTFRAKARIPGAAHLADAQNRLTRIMTDHGGLRQAMRKAAFTGMLSPYFAVKVTYDEKEKVPYKRVHYDAVEARDCGYEPFHRRFKWHAYDMQWGDLPKHWRPDITGEEEPKAWEIVRVTEVYHDGFRHSDKSTKGIPMSIFVSRTIPKKDSGEIRLEARPKQANTLGTYVITETIPECPIVMRPVPRPRPQRRRPRRRSPLMDSASCA